MTDAPQFTLEETDQMGQLLAVASEAAAAQTRLILQAVTSPAAVAHFRHLREMIDNSAKADHMASTPTILAVLNMAAKQMAAQADTLRIIAALIERRHRHDTVRLCERIVNGSSR